MEASEPDVTSEDAGEADCLMQRNKIRLVDFTPDPKIESALKHKENKICPLKKQMLRTAIEVSSESEYTQLPDDLRLSLSQMLYAVDAAVEEYNSVILSKIEKHRILATLDRSKDDVESVIKNIRLGKYQ